MLCQSLARLNRYILIYTFISFNGNEILIFFGRFIIYYFKIYTRFAVKKFLIYILLIKIRFNMCLIRSFIDHKLRSN